MIDQYEFYINKSGTRFYYKSKKLHREAGPAIVTHEDVEKYSSIADKNIYKKIAYPVIESNSDFVNYIDDHYYGDDSKSTKLNGLMDFSTKDDDWNQQYIIQKHEMAWNNSAFFLHDVEYTEEEFKKKQITAYQNKLQHELPHKSIEKKTKLKL